MRVLHVCPFVGDRIGGSERYTFNLSKAQSQTHDVHILTTTRFLDRVGTSSENGVTIHRVYSPIILWNINPLCFAVKKLVSIRPDIMHVHSFLYTLSVQAILGKILSSRKAVLQIHGGVGLPPYPTGLVRTLVKRLYDPSLGHLAISNSEIIASVSKLDLKGLAKMHSIPQERLRYVPNFVDIKKFKPEPRLKNNSNLVVLYVGDLEEWKGVGTLIKWLAKFEKSASKKIQFQFVGQGSLYPQLLSLKKRFESKGSNIDIEILGSVNHTRMPIIMNKAKALILPSFWEGMPTVVLEAMACGTPVLATPVGDVPVVIKHNETGFLIAKGTLTGLDEALSSILTNDGLVKELTQRALIQVRKNNTIRATCGLTDAIYAEIASQY